MKVIYVGVGDLAASADPEAVLKTMALGSCVAVLVLAPRQRAMGLLHVQLPDSKINPDKAKAQPAAFADTGVPALLNAMGRFGCRTSELVIKLAGGAQIMDPNNTFDIGKRNILATKKALWAHRLGAIAEDLGGTITRTVTMNLATGHVVLSCPGKDDWLL